MTVRVKATESIQIAGEAGVIEALLDEPAQVRGIALVGHPHPLYGGCNTNKVVYTLAHCFCALGYVALRPNFRGVGKSEGCHDLGIAETEDMLTVLSWAQSRWPVQPVALGGFSFGGYVQTRVAARLADGATPAQRIALVGLATGEAGDGSRGYDTGALPKAAEALIIHGEFDETVPLANIFEWARPQAQPVIVIPGADHFFHSKLGVIRQQLQARWSALADNA